MTEADRRRWDTRYLSAGPGADEVTPPEVFAAHIDAFPAAGLALDLACGRGSHSVWLAHRGLDVLGLDISPVAVELARDLARRNGVDGHCRFAVTDLDQGLPPGPRFDLILCNKFRDRRLDRAIIGRLAPGGLLAIATLSEIDSTPGAFRARPGELTAAFAELDIVDAGESRGLAWLLGRAAPQ